jgi:hypothetical protein
VAHVDVADEPARALVADPREALESLDAAVGLTGSRSLAFRYICCEFFAAPGMLAFF